MGGAQQPRSHEQRDFSFTYIADRELVNDRKKVRSKVTGIPFGTLPRRGRILPFMEARYSKDSIRVF